MGFGLNVNVKVEAPKIEVPKVDVAATLNDAVNTASGAVSGAIDNAKATASSAIDDAKAAASAAVDNAKSTVNGAVDSAKNAASEAIGTVTGAVAGVVNAANGALASLSSLTGAIADMAVSFTGAVEDIVLEPHISLDANACYADTLFEKGPIWIRLDHTPDEAKENTDTLHVFSESGAYDETQKVSDFTDDNGKTVVLLFEDAPMNEKYSLEIIKEDGGTKTIFSDITYGDLRKTKQRHV